MPVNTATIECDTCHQKYSSVICILNKEAEVKLSVCDTCLETLPDDEIKDCTLVHTLSEELFESLIPAQP
jgi:hypothetical protein